MGIPGSANPMLFGGAAAYQINQSLRFNSADSAYLNRTAGTPTDNKKWTWSAWAKISGASQALNFASSGSGTSMYFGLETSQGDNFIMQIAGTRVYKSTAIFRDPSAWYHIVFVFDSANGTQADRSILYINGVRQAATTASVTLNQTTGFNAASTAMNIGYSNAWTATSSDYFSGYLAEVNFIDGQALTPSSFGETDTITGAWIPKKYSGSYGTNGFYLKFEGSGIGTDSSGNGNNFTATGFSTSGTGTDVMSDTPTNNWCTLNPLDQITGRSDLTNGNLDISTGPTTNGQARSTLALPSSGKHYFEATVTSGTSASAQINVGLLGQTSTNTGSFVSGMYSLTFDTGRRTVINGTLSSRAGTAASTNDVIQVAVDMSTGNGWVGQNNTWYDSSNGTTGNPATGANSTFTGLSSLILCGFGWTYNNGLVFNFGQRPFAYTPPSGFLALNTQNLPEPSIKKPNQYMDVLTYTGDSNATKTITGLGFNPDLVWIKNRNLTNPNAWFDSVRGVNKFLSSNYTTAEENPGLYGYVSAFNSDGFTLTTNGPSGFGYVNGATNTYVAWCWDESATPGFDIVTYTGNGTARTIAHSLGVAPSMIIFKNRNVGTTDWAVYFKSLVEANSANYVKLNSTDAVQTSPSPWNGTLATSSVFSVGTWDSVNGNGNGIVAYCFSEVAGFSKFGSYTGNGSSDGSFVFCGFRPKVVWFKRTDSTGSWFIEDSARGTYNAMGPELYANSADAESTVTRLDFLSNGFKMRAANAGDNASGGTYIFCAWAESPFKYSLAR